MPTIPANVRFVLYLIGLIGGLAVTLAVAESWIDGPLAAFFAGILAILNGLAAGNVDRTSTDAPASVDGA